MTRTGAGTRLASDAIDALESVEKLGKPRYGPAKTRRLALGQGRLHRQSRDSDSTSVHETQRRDERSMTAFASSRAIDDDRAYRGRESQRLHLPVLPCTALDTSHPAIVAPPVERGAYFLHTYCVLSLIESQYNHCFQWRLPRVLHLYLLLYRTVLTSPSNHLYSISPTFMWPASSRVMTPHSRAQDRQSAGLMTIRQTKTGTSQRPPPQLRRKISYLTHIYILQLLIVHGVHARHRFHSPYQHLHRR
jgi:hypothetical protein